MTEYLRAGCNGSRGGVGGRSEETLLTGGAAVAEDDERVADKAAIQSVKVQPRQLGVADAQRCRLPGWA